ncbi:MAG: hypothetical protein K8E66_02595 [Phycisphaerales bacterium]|nr:hypothetical protein [Phycisphaerales bacterium]
MGIYKREEVCPEWEPIPWDAKGPQIDEQEKGFHQRSLKPIVWAKLDWDAFPDEGIFGRDRKWFMEREIAYVTTFEGEDLILIEHDYSGFPDPPRWALASRPAGSQAEWQVWGHFPKLPDAWAVPDTSD